MSLPMIPFILMVVGLIVFASTDKSVAKEIGRACFWTGLLVIVLGLASWPALSLHR